MITLLAAVALAIPPESVTGWVDYGNADFRTECVTWDGEPWCRAFGSSKAPLETLGTLIEDRRAYPKVYSRISQTEILDDAREIFRMCIDLPALIGDRDQVVQATKRDDGGVRVYHWESVVHPQAPAFSGYTRLPHAAGEWRLVPRADGGTDLRYTWQADMRGNLPNWILRRIWKATGPEILGETIAAAEKKP